MKSEVLRSCVGFFGFVLLGGLIGSPSAFGQPVLTLASQIGGTYTYSISTKCFGCTLVFGPSGTAVSIPGLSGVTGATISLVGPAICGLTMSYDVSSVTATIVPGIFDKPYCTFSSEPSDTLVATLVITSNVTSPGPVIATFETYDFSGAGPFPLNLPTTGPVAATLTVPIIVHPGGGQPPTINTSNNGKIAVAILSSASWSAPANVNPNSLTFGETGNEQSFVNCNVPSDVNGDGYLDLVCNFNSQQTMFKTSDTTANLKGMTTGSLPLQGSATVRVNK